MNNSKWLVQESFGLNIPITKLQHGYITDNLIEYRNINYRSNILSSIIFFTGKIGFEAAIVGNFTKVYSDDIFINDVNKKYSNKYYVDINTNNDNSFVVFVGNFGRFLIGPVYKIVKGKLLILPKFLIGPTSFATNNANVSLKEKNSNQLIEIYYSQKYLPPATLHLFTVNPSLTFGYKITKHIVFNFDVNFYNFKTNFYYKQTIIDVNTERNLTNMYFYKSSINSISFVVGIIFIMI